MGEPGTSEEEYLTTLFELEEDGVPVIRARVAERLGVSAAAASEAIERLTRRGYIRAGTDRRLRLSDTGREVAVRVVRRHRLAECLLVDVLGLAWAKAHREASRWEHVISQDVEECLVEVLGDPATCPHGNPIPGSRQAVEVHGSLPLAEVQPGPMTVIRISEQLQVEASALERLAQDGLLPGSTVTVAVADGDGVTVRTDAGERVLPAGLARHVWVRPG